MRRVPCVATRRGRLHAAGGLCPLIRPSPFPEAAGSFELDAEGPCPSVPAACAVPMTTTVSAHRQAFPGVSSIPPAKAVLSAGPLRDTRQQLAPADVPMYPVRVPVNGGPLRRFPYRDATRPLSPPPWSRKDQSPRRHQKERAVVRPSHVRPSMYPRSARWCPDDTTRTRGSRRPNDQESARGTSLERRPAWAGGGCCCP